MDVAGVTETAGQLALPVTAQLVKPARPPARRKAQPQRCNQCGSGPIRHWNQHGQRWWTCEEIWEIEAECAVIAWQASRPWQRLLNWFDF
jgi:hypothetical protein